MKVLWVTYVIMPEVLHLLSSSASFKSSGGWLQGSAENLVKNTDVELSVAIVNRQIPTYKKINGKTITYYLIPFGKGFDYYSDCYDEYWKTINKDFNPDIVHVHGVESTLALSYIRCSGADNVVVSIQGLVSVISRFYYDSIPFIDLLKSISLRDLLTLKPIFYYKRDFYCRAKFEYEIISSIKYVIGRTSWDRAHIFCQNPKVHYYHCNETLRDIFYGKRWCFKNCRPHSIFLSQGSMAFKGAHQILEAMQYILSDYPDTVLRIAGNSLSMDNSFKGFIKRTGYENYIRKLIKKYRLENHVIFLGALSAEQMLDEYLKANIFICPSTIENSSNSVAEAQLLGVPLIASYVGGIPDMIPNDQCGILFRVGEYEMLAQAVIRLFNNSQFFDNSKMRLLAFKRHDRQINAKLTYNIYEEILNNSL